jgi:hypothetical protein
MVTFDPFPRCGDDVGAVVTTVPCIQTKPPCGCGVAFDGGSVHDESDERGAQYVDDTSVLSVVRNGVG